MCTALVQFYNGTNMTITSYTNTYTNNTQKAFQIPNGTNVNFSVSTDIQSTYSWYINKKIQSNTTNSLDFVVPDSKDIWEILIKVIGTSTEYLKWIITTIPLSEAPNIIDYFHDGKLFSRTDTDPWGRQLSTWANFNGNINFYNATDLSMKSTASGSAQQGDHIRILNSIKYGTWKFKVYFTLNNLSGYNGYGFFIKSDNSKDRNKFSYCTQTDSHMYVMWNDKSGNYTRIDEDSGFMWTNSVGWHDITLILTEDGGFYEYIDGIAGHLWHQRNPDMSFTSTTYPSGTLEIHNPFGNDNGFSLGHLGGTSQPAYFDCLEIYDHKYLFPDGTISYGQFYHNTGPKNSNNVYPIETIPSIIIRKSNTTLQDIANQINDLTKFSYDSITKTAYCYVNMTIGDAFGHGELILNGETLYFSPTSNGNILFSIFQGSKLKITNSTIDSSNNYYWKWRINSPGDVTGYPVTKLLVTQGLNGFNPVFDALAFSSNVYIEIYNSTINKGSNFWIYAPYVLKIIDSNITNMYADTHGHLSGNFFSSGLLNERKNYWNTPKNFMWVQEFQHISDFEIRNVNFSTSSSSLNNDISLIQNDELFQKLNVYNINFGNNVIRVRKPIKIFSQSIQKNFYYNTRTALVNCTFTNSIIDSDRAELVSKYYLDVKVVDSLGNPISGANLTITNEIDSNYPVEIVNTNTEYFRDGLDCTNSPSYCWQTSTANVHYSEKFVLYNYNDNNIKITEFKKLLPAILNITTDVTGHTPLPTFPTSNCPVVAAYSKTQSSTKQFTYSITAEKAGVYKTITGITPTDLWYRSNPLITNSLNTIIITLPIVTGTGNVSGYVYNTSNDPISNVSINIDTLSTTTDINGFYQITGIPEGTHNVTASKTGYSDQIKSATIIKDLTTTINFQLLNTCPTPTCDFIIIQ